MQLRTTFGLGLAAVLSGCSMASGPLSAPPVQIDFRGYRAQFTDEEPTYDQ